MGIRFACHSCGKPLNIKNELAGRRGVCPACKVRFRIPPGDAACSIPLEESAEPGQSDLEHVEHDSKADVSRTTKIAASGSSRDITDDSAAVATMTAQAPVPTNRSAPTTSVSTTPEPIAADANAGGAEILSGDEPATWYVRPPSGGQYGPAETKVLRDWIDQGRVAKTALLWRDGWPQWREASEVLAEIVDQLPGAMRSANAGPTNSGPTNSLSNEKTKSIAAEETSPLDSSLMGSALIGATRRKRTNRRLTLVAVLGALVVGLVVTLFLVASAGA
ncbi:DUF4339 domain-containing protein [Rhodopirellula sp. MGV]|uniref:DUF4339 domain-containing protein n=1 Tax=Rhodopirellula sp. MGV TaxID=2023130 RepID=UPI000B965BB2|nr:DUF4339 domain-containing protein [Rhodopirellula sp. MGV]OYP35002.1 hypothetical protein CGZ80_13400 [Rhodopirellula sp. MGV]PNY38102.1 DUF4339 domain-containing protein [Rhodopirellula baltica]